MINLHVRSHPTLAWYLLTIFLIAVAVNYVWEIGQISLFEGLKFDWATFAHCFVASLGDGVMLWIIYIVGVIVFKKKDWFAVPSVNHYAIMLLTGLILSVSVEWIALEALSRWEYNERMPVIPILDVGLTPVLQMLILPPLIFSLVATLSARRTVRT